MRKGMKLGAKVKKAMAGGRGRGVSKGIRESGYSERAMFPRQLRNGSSTRGVQESDNPTRGLRPSSQR